MKEFYDHVHQNLELFNHWIENQSRLQISNDIFKPLIPVFQEANPTVNIYGCQDCIIDMLIWCRMQYKKPGPVKLTQGFVKECTSKSFSDKLEETATKIETKHKGKKK